MEYRERPMDLGPEFAAASDEAVILAWLSYGSNSFIRPPPSLCQHVEVQKSVEVRGYPRGYFIVMR